MKIITALWLAAISVAAAQQPPGSSCDFDGFDLNSKLAEVAHETTAYYGCATGTCLPMRLNRGNSVVITRVEGKWTCGYLVARKGSAQGWVRFADVRPVSFDANPPLSAWVGKWIQDLNHVSIQLSKTPGKLSLDGDAVWVDRGYGRTGEISGDATPVANKVHLGDENDICTVDLALLGKYILANDNNMCGGVNVRFWGVWKRAAAP